MYVFVYGCFFSFFFSLFPRKGFFVATFCMRSILFAGSNREKKIASFLFSPLLLLLLNKKSPYALSFSFFFYTTTRKREREGEKYRSLSLSASSPPRECMTRACSTCLHKKEISFISTNHFLARY